MNRSVNYSVMSSRVRNWNYEFGAQKRKKQRRLEQVASQKGAIDKFVFRESQNSTQHQTLHSDGDGNHRDNTDNVEVHTSVVDSEPINPNIVEARTLETDAENTDGIDSEPVPFQPDIRSEVLGFL